MTRPKVFQIGFNKCGTTSLHRFFERSGLRSVHWDGGYLAPRMEDNIRAGRRAIAGYEEYDAFSELSYMCEHRVVEIGFQYLDVLLEQEPDARFVLNVRPVEKWIKSRLAMGDDLPVRKDGFPVSVNETRCPASVSDCLFKYAPVERCRRYYGLADLDDVVDLWRNQWDQHVAAVERLAPAGRLLVFDIERGDPVLLCDFLGLPRSMAKHYGHANPTTPPAVRAVTGWIPVPVKRLMPRAVKNRAKVLLGRVAGCMGSR